MKLLIVGLGSMGKRRARLTHGIDPTIKIVGVDSAEARRAEAVELGLVEAAYPSIKEAVDAAAPAGSEPGLAAVDTDGLYAFLQAQLGDAMTADCVDKVMANRLPTRITALAGQSGDKLTPADLTLKKHAGAENCYDFSAALLTAADSTAAAQVSGTITMVKEDGRWKASAITLNL